MCMPIVSILAQLLIAGPLQPAESTPAPPPATAGATQAPEPLNVFRGRVLDHATREPVAGAKVLVAAAEKGVIHYARPELAGAYAPDDKVLLFFTKRNGKRSAEVVTDTDGRFLVRGLAAGQYNVMAVHAERGVAIMENVSQPNDDAPLDVVLAPPTFVEAHIRGLPTNAFGGGLMCSLVPAAPSDRIYVRLDLLRSMLSPIEADPTPYDRWTAGPMPAFTGWTLQAENYVVKRGFSAPRLVLPVTVEPGKTTKLDVDLTKGAKLSGQVRGPKGEPLEDVSVVLRTPGEPPTVYGTLTDADGKYTLPGVPDGAYALEAKRWARRTAPG